MGKGEAINITFPIMMRLFGRKSSGSSGEEDGHFGLENQDLEIWVWGRKLSCLELYTPLHLGEDENNLTMSYKTGGGDVDLRLIS